MKLGVPFVKEVIPWVAMIDSRWKEFPLDSFDPEQHKAHRALYDTVADEFQRLLDDDEEAKIQAREKKNQEKLAK